MTQNKINSKRVFSQKVTTSRTDAVTLSAIIPADNTIPQQSEGTEILTLSITPKTTTSTLLIEFTSPVTKDANKGSITVALFQDAGANAIDAGCMYVVAANVTQLAALRFVMISGTTSLTTFKIRMGPSSNSAYLNADSSGNPVMGGVSETRLTITEIL